MSDLSSERLVPTLSGSHSEGGTESPRDRRRRSFVVGCWFALVIAMVIKSGADPISHSVYGCYESASARWWAGESLYFTTTGEPTYYLYSPTFAALFSPSGLLPTRLGAVLWIVVNVGAVALCLRIFTRDLLSELLTKTECDWVWGLSLLGFTRGLWASQTNALVVSMVAAGLALAYRNRTWSAAALLTLPIYIKLWPAAAVMLLVACRPRTLLPKLLVCGVGMACVPFLLASPLTVLNQYREWFVLLTGPHQVRLSAYRDAWTIANSVFGVSLSIKTFQLLGLAAAGALLAVVWTSHHRLKGSAESLLILLGGWSCWQLLFGPGAERNTYGILMPALAVVLVRSRKWSAAHICSLVSLTLLLAFGMSGSLERKLAAGWIGAEALLPSASLWLLVAIGCSKWTASADTIAFPETNSPPESALRSAA